MAIKTLHSSNVTFMDVTDDRKLDIYISSNHPTTQLYNSNTKVYTPNWSTTNLQLNAEVYLDSEDVTTKAQTTINWYAKVGITETLISSGKSVTISTNALATNPIITYVCKAKYQNVDAISQIVFTRVDTGLNGANGTSVNIKGTATSVSPVANTSYYTIAYASGNMSSAELNDAYMYNGDLYVCVDSRDGVDYFINVGRIQGPPGENAKNIILSGSAQVFKVSKTNAIAPATISVTAHTFNTSATIWTYSINGGQTFLSTAPTGVVRNGNIVTVTGSTLASNSLVIKASDGTVEDVFTIYKASDGTDGSDGAQGDPAPLVFLTNENISFAANASGQIATTAFATNVVAYTGTTKVTPVIGTIAGLPTGMTVSAPVTTANELILTFSIANNSTFGSAASNSGTITIPITSPVSTNLKLSWSKINTGATGAGIRSTTVTYGSSDSSAVQPTEWQSTIPTVADGKYLWTRTVIDYTDDAIADTVTYIYAKQGSVGDVGPSGSSVTVSSIQYQEGASATTAPTGTWSNTVVAVADGRYLWTKTIFSDNKVAYGVAKQGSSGRGISKITEYYLATTASSGVTTATSGWTEVIQIVDSSKRYLWNYEVVTYTDNTTSSTTPVIIGVFGNTGATGKGINSVTEYYLASAEPNGVTTSTTGWTTAMQTLTAINKYLWNYELITYTDGTTSTIAPIIIGVYGDIGPAGMPGSDAVTFQVYSNNGYVLSANTPTITLQTFSYIGDTEITAGATYQWYSYIDGIWSIIAGKTFGYLDVSRDDVSFSNSYMCKMTFNGVEYTGVVTIDDKNDSNAFFSSKPPSYTAGDFWLTATDYTPPGYSVGTLLRAEHTSSTYSDDDWVIGSKYDEQIKNIKDDLDVYNQYFSFDSTDGLRISARDANGAVSEFSTSLTNERLAFNYGDEAIAYIDGTKMNIREAEIESPLTVTGKYSGSTMQQAPIINIGNFSIVVESNGSLSIVANI